MTLLEQIKTGRCPAPTRMMLYGLAGIGKSSFAASAPSPIFISTEDGLGHIDCHSFPLATTFEQVMQSLRALYSEEHEYRTVVVDSVDWVERLIWAEVCRERNVESIESIGYAKGYVFALTHWNAFLKGLSELRKTKGMAVILIAHARIERFENPETDAYDRYTPRLHRLASGVLQDWCDAVLFAAYKVLTKQADQGFGRTRTQGLSTGERILRTTERPAYIAKNRLNLPDTIPLDWSVFTSSSIQAGNSTTKQEQGDR